MDLIALRRRAMDRLGDHVDQVVDAQWDEPTPCSEWDVRALVNHIVYENAWAAELMAGTTIEEVGDRLDGDLLGDHPKRAFAQSAAAANAAFDHPDAATRTVGLSRGPTPVSDYLAELLLDAVIHDWDLAKAIGQDTAIPADLTEAAWELVGRGEADLSGARAMGAFAAAVDVGPGASTQDRLLGLLGRTP